MSDPIAFPFSPCKFRKRQLAKILPVFRFVQLAERDPGPFRT